MTDRRDPFEEKVREALRSGSERPDQGAGDDSTELLERVHRGAARRRVRRRAGALVATAGLVSAVLVTLPLLTPSPSDDQTANAPTAGGDTDRSRESAGGGAADRVEPRADEPHKPKQPKATVFDAVPMNEARAIPVEVKDVRVTSVSGLSEDEVWVSGYGTCNEADLCNVLGHSGDGGADMEFRTLPVSGYSRQTTVRFTPDGTTGWATDGGAVYRTDSAGRSWVRLQQPADVRVRDLEVWDDEVWAVGNRSTSQKTVVLAGHRTSYELIPVHESREVAADGAVAMGSMTFGLRRDDPEGNFARTSDGGRRWAESKIGCEPADVSAAEDVAWVLCGDDQALVRSTDQGSTWHPPESLDSSAIADEPPSMVAAIDADTAFVAGSGAGWVVENRVAKQAEGIGDGSYADVIFSTEQVGYLIGSDGHLCRSEDGGLTWRPVELP